MRNIPAIAAICLALLGCSPSEKSRESHDDFHARKAAHDLLCAEDRRDQELALGSFAVAIGTTPEDEREDTAWQIAEEVNCDKPSPSRPDER